MNKRVKVKLKLMRVVHGVKEVWITKDDVYTECPDNFTGTFFKWYDDGQLMYEWHYKNGELHGLSLAWERDWEDGEYHRLCRGWNENGQLQYGWNYKDGELIE